MTATTPLYARAEIVWDSSAPRRCLERVFELRRFLLVALISGMIRRHDPDRRDPGPPSSCGRPSSPCFEETLLGTVRGELGAQAVEAALDRACDRFGFTPDSCKNGVVLREAFHLLAGQGLTSPTLSTLMDRVATLGGGS